MRPPAPILHSYTPAEARAALEQAIRDRDCLLGMRDRYQGELAEVNVLLEVARGRITGLRKSLGIE